MARTAPAVPSGRRVIERPPLSSKVYICFSTTSVVSPTPRKNSSVCSNTGVRTSRNPLSSASPRKTSSISCHFFDFPGTISTVPLGAFVISSIPMSPFSVLPSGKTTSSVLSKSLQKKETKASVSLDPYGLTLSRAHTRPTRCSRSAFLWERDALHQVAYFPVFGKAFLVLVQRFVQRCFSLQA